MKAMLLGTLAAALAAFALAGCGPVDAPVPPEALAATYDALVCPDRFAEEERRETELTAAKADMDVATRTRVGESTLPGR